MTLTAEQQAHKDDIKARRDEIVAARQTLHELETGCKCVLEPSRGGSMRCAICDKSHGWACPHSPDKVCHYFSFDGKIELVSGEYVDVPDDHDGMASDESEDWCIYCGDPDERK